jgi:hypothetical protein
LAKIIINADDFGLKSSVNGAISELFNRGLINSTTIMANMPFFDEAVELAFRNKFNNNIGIHLNIDEGNHLTNELHSTNLFDENNNFRLKRNNKTLFFLTKREKGLIFNEFESQIGKVRKAGIQITHIDTHHHVHEIWPLTRIIIALLKKYNIQSMRILNTLNKSTKFYKHGYRVMVNRFIKMYGRNFTDLFGNQLEVLSYIKNNPSAPQLMRIEVMVHPDYNAEGRIFDNIQDKEYDFDYRELLQ